MFTRDELKQIADAIGHSAECVLAAHGIVLYDQHGTPAHTITGQELTNSVLAAEIGNNSAQALLDTFGEILPEITRDEERSARSAVYASAWHDLEGGRAARAGILQQVATTLTQTLGKDHDDALALLERRLYALWLATRRLRKQPAECQAEHLIIADKHGHICVRCGERVEQ